MQPSANPRDEGSKTAAFAFAASLFSWRDGCPVPGPDPFRDRVGHQYPISRFSRGRAVSYNISPCHIERMGKRSRKRRDRALAIEFWIATLLVGGSFIVGLAKALGYLFGP
jgi:hypothetical protein